MKKAALLCFALVLWMGGASSLRAEALVSLRAASEIKGSAIRLSDVFDGVSQDKDMDLALAPEPGKSVTYNVQVLAALAEKHGLIWKPQSLLDSAVLTRASVQVTPEMIREKIVRKISEIEKLDVQAVDIDLGAHKLGAFLPVEANPVFDLNKFSYDAQNRRFQTEVVIPTKGAPITQAVTGRVIIRRDVPVLAHYLQAGTVIGPGDLTWQTMEEDRIARNVLMEAPQIIGLELRTDRGQGDMLRERDLLPPRLVTRGSLVTIKIETPLMRITARGKSLQDGAKGDVVRVTNLQSKRVLEGTVESSGIVRIETTKRLAWAE